MRFMRTLARETLFKYIFSTQFSGENEAFKSSLYKADKLTDEDVDYCNRVVEAISTHQDEILSVIDRCSSAFPHTNIFSADKAILCIAVAELMYMEDIPEKVSLNEAANIASKYSSDRSASFVSGVLSGVVKENNQNVENN